MPTCAIAEFTFETKSWPKADKSTLAAVRLERPKNHGAFPAHDAATIANQNRKAIPASNSPSNMAVPLIATVQP